MRVRIKVGQNAEEAGWGVAKVFGLIVVLGALVSSSTRAPVKANSGNGPKTVLPATIRAARVDSLTVSSPARVRAVLVTPGQTVRAGQLLAELESDDVERQVASAQRRVAMAEVRSGTRKPSGNAGRMVELQTRSAEHSLELAKKRVQEFTLTDAETAWAAAKTRRDRIAALVKQHLATDVELQNAEREEQAERRNLKAARDQESRLAQELELSEVQAAMLRAQAPPGDGTGETTARIEMEDARSALAEAVERQVELQVRAPHDGVVLSTVLNPGDRVYAGSPILYVADQSKLSFEAPVTPVLARQIKPGDTVRVRVPTEPPRQIDAQVSSVALAPDPVHQSYVVRAVIANPDRNTILVGMEGAIEFPHSESAWRRPF